VHFVDDEGGVIEKEVLPEKLHMLIDAAEANLSTVWREGPWLPKNCLRHATGNGGQKVLIHVPSGLRDTWLFDQRIQNLPFPDLIFGFVLNGTAVSKKYVVAVKDLFIQPNTQLYRYPYSNVYDDALACWNDVPEIEELWQVNGLPTVFFGCPDNGHLYSPNTQTMLNMSYRQLIETMQMKDVFPKDILVSRQETLDDLWQRM